MKAALVKAAPVEAAPVKVALVKAALVKAAPVKAAEAGGESMRRAAHRSGSIPRVQKADTVRRSPQFFTHKSTLVRVGPLFYLASLLFFST